MKRWYLSGGIFFWGGFNKEKVSAILG